ncbi:MAG: hypothetical protein IJI92_00565 [Erysipelotrichaceae bacterium]|nr:hypothetical protein [Erysipelotrichaceae bacterium]
MEKVGPIEKIYEAFSALADGRVEFSDDVNEAHVQSSNGKKSYTVVWEGDVYSSNDNATYWQAYPGYPLIAVLIRQGRVKADEKALPYFKNINWHELNTRFKRDYAKAFEHVMNERGYDVDVLKKAADEVYEQLKELDITIRRGKNRPPK